MQYPGFALLNGTIWTGDNRIPQAEAFASLKGKITAVGTTEEIQSLCNRNTTIFDARQRLVLPGFIDGHTHFVMGGFSLTTLNLTGIISRGEFITALQKHHKQLPPEIWLTGIGWDNSRWTPSELPHRVWIDEIIPDRPVYLIRQDMHTSVANSRALECAGITETTPNPDGGVIDRDSHTGIPTGILRDSAMILIERVIPKPDTNASLYAIKAACAECARFGITNIHDITLMYHISHLEKAAQEKWFTVRVLMRLPLTEWETTRTLKTHFSANPDLLTIGGLKAYTDGSLGSSTAWFLEPYSDNPASSGVPNEIMFPEGNLLRLAADADKAGFSLSIHAIGDRANREVLNIFKQILHMNGYRDRRWRIEHAQHIHPDDFIQFHTLNVIASMQPYHCIDDARWCEQRIGSERCNTAYAFKTFSEKGVRLVFGSDWTVAPLNPISGIDAAVNRIPIDAEKPWHSEQRITVEQTVKAYTAEPAYAAFEEHCKGSLTIGKYADCVVLSENIFNINPETIKTVRVCATIFNGNVVYEDS